MINQAIKQRVVAELLPHVQTPAQYVGSELNVVTKDHRGVRGKLCMVFPDTYQIGMSHHGLQVLYTLMNARSDWVCERAFTPAIDMEERMLARRCALVQFGKRSRRSPNLTSSVSRSSTKSATRTCSRSWTWPASHCGPRTVRTPSR